MEKLTNWAGNYTYSAARLHYPETMAEVQDVVRRADKLRVLGSRHSFNDIADSPADLLSLAQFDPGLTFDRERSTVTVPGGITYGALGRQLQSAGYALANLASLPHIAVAGACATGTHGSGDRNGNLATSVAALELVTADGEIVVLSRDQPGDDFAGAVVGLGGLGVVTRVTLDVEPAYQVRQDVYENLPMAQVEAHFEEIEASAYSVSMFSDWHPERMQQVWLKRRVTDGAPGVAAPEFFGAPAAQGPMHPIRALSAVTCTEQMGVPGPWYDRLPHFRLDFTPSSGAELQSEYLVPRRHAVAALRAILGLRDQVVPLLQVTEIRTIAADHLWMSPSYEQDSVGIHFTWLPDWPAVRAVLPQIETALAPLAARPHWGKLFTLPAARLPALYPRLPDFQRLLRTYDPVGKFRNPFLDRYIFGAA